MTRIQATRNGSFPLVQLETGCQNFLEGVHDLYELVPTAYRTPQTSLVDWVLYVGFTGRVQHELFRGTLSIELHTLHVSHLR